MWRLLRRTSPDAPIPFSMDTVPRTRAHAATIPFSMDTVRRNCAQIADQANFAISPQFRGRPSALEHDVEEAFAAFGPACAGVLACEVQKADAGGEGGAGAQLGLLSVETVVQVGL